MADLPPRGAEMEDPPDVSWTSSECYGGCRKPLRRWRWRGKVWSCRCDQRYVLDGWRWRRSLTLADIAEIERDHDAAP